MIKRFFKALLLIFLIALISCGAGYFYYSWNQKNEMEAERPMAQLAENVMNSPGFVPSDQIPDFLKEATVSVEDSRFYSHQGLDYPSIVRAFLSQFLPFFQKSGGSTITQQVVKNLYGRYEGGIKWKGTEMLMAMELEKMYSKEQILSMYLNIINYGNDYHGIGQASQGYFLCLPMQLDQAECSILAGIPQSPSNYELTGHFDAAKAKQKIVLNAMVRNHYISQEEADQIYAQPIYYVASGYWQEGLAAVSSFGFNLSGLILPA